ncbi:UDP-N-acetyl-D-mannosamine dehydrogenase [Chromobacterium sp. IIBBL 290-4]|uniref:UDP-N-acetyl-D-mannosamine dehydrogenase n=1 Tax=Chromobacterium sp. IIBBL 290-4 TaxID=2953890 RepID=UPI0020B6E54C|nr:UDP-N-acetyl-D-mannosamine dehydrogenase [Chromobacterium sp. IIBBL 290-4]UTH76252.1 UDP-N-acetyl-D-mannosamine dehydrogenase [Chromobacterium sp. IIBBL 290-4]
MKKISVIGLGYIGLPTAAMFASHKAQVIGVDINQHAVDTINQGKIHIVEPELDTIVHSAVTEGYLRATTQPEPSDAFLIAVPTPFKGNYEPDLSHVKSACEAIAPVLKQGDIVILESTSPVGSTEQMVQWLSRWRKDLTIATEKSDECDIYVAYCPERVLPGQVVRELVENDRIIGGINPVSSQKAKEVYQIFVRGELLVSNARTAEMAKLTENAYRDVNIAFANELSLICDKLDINVWDLISLANRHPRVNILKPGPGVGGHCIAVDPWFIVNKTPEQARLIHSARVVNDSKPDWVILQVKNAVSKLEALGQPKEMIKIACFGLAFKPDIDDLRESPALNITNKLDKLYPGQILAVEPNINVEPKSLAKTSVRMTGYEEAIQQAHLLVLLVSHKEFKEIAQHSNAQQLIIDTVGIAANQQ